MKSNWSLFFLVMACIGGGFALFGHAAGPLMTFYRIALVVIGVVGFVTLEVLARTRPAINASAPNDNVGPTSANPHPSSPLPPATPAQPAEGIASGPPVPAPQPAPPPPGAISAEPMPMPPIPILVPPTPKPVPTQTGTGKKDEPKDTFRELLETIVFVVVLVLMLKTFLAEAFVIPTGSMADTLLGYHHKATCQQCGKENLVNASDEADPQRGEPARVTSFKCQNCQFLNPLQPNQRPGPRGGGQ